MNTNQKGDLAEMAVAKRAIEKGYTVAICVGENSPYDMIIDVGGVLKRVQVKSREPNDKGIILQVMTSSAGTKWKETVDVMAIYNRKNDSVYWIDIKEHPVNASITLRFREPKYGIVPRHVMAEQYRW